MGSSRLAVQAHHLVGRHAGVRAALDARRCGGRCSDVIGPSVSRSRVRERRRAAPGRPVPGPAGGAGGAVGMGAAMASRRGRSTPGDGHGWILCRRVRCRRYRARDGTDYGQSVPRACVQPAPPDPSVGGICRIALDGPRGSGMMPIQVARSGAKWGEEVNRSGRHAAVAVDVGHGDPTSPSVKESGEARPLTTSDVTVGAAQPGVHR